MRTLAKLAMLGAMALSASIAIAEELKLAHFMSPKHPYHNAVFNRLGERVSTATGGDLTIRIYPGGELGAGPVEQFNRAVDGVADIAFAIQGYTAAQFPKSLLMELPGVLKDESKGPAGFANAFDMIKDEYKRVHVLALWNNGPAVLFTRNKPVEQLADLQGMKIRVASKGGGDLVEAWGATPVFMPITELYTSIQTGVVDGAIIDPGAAMAFKLIEVAKYMTVGMESTVTIFTLVMNRDSYDDLSDSQKAALDAGAGLELSKIANQSWSKFSKTSAKVFGDKEGRRIIELSDEALAEFNAIATKVREAKIAELEARGIPASLIVAAMQGG